MLYDEDMKDPFMSIHYIHYAFDVEQRGTLNCKPTNLLFSKFYINKTMHVLRRNAIQLEVSLKTFNVNLSQKFKFRFCSANQS